MSVVPSVRVAPVDPVEPPVAPVVGVVVVAQPASSAAAAVSARADVTVRLVGLLKGSFSHTWLDVSACGWARVPLNVRMPYFPRRSPGA